MKGSKQAQGSETEFAVVRLTQRQLMLVIQAVEGLQVSGNLSSMSQFVVESADLSRLLRAEIVETT